jgi:protocatechuate 3,4-dioxygenase beta subunit
MLDRRTVVIGLTAAAVSREVLVSPLPVTPQEMLGPFYPEHPLPDHDFDLTRIRGHSGRAGGQVIELVGRVLLHGEVGEAAMSAVALETTLERWAHRFL